MIIAIDGPAASGKSTTARGVAKVLGFEYLDTGSLYRAFTLAAIHAEVPAEPGAHLDDLLAELQLRYRYYKGKITLSLSGRDVTEEIRSPEVTRQVSAYSALPGVRREMVKLQRKFAEGKNVVAEGRDIGTVVFPNAELKVFLVSDQSVRAQRRAEEFRSGGRDVEAGTVEGELEERDKLDSGREHSPLLKADDAVQLDNSQLTIEGQVAAVVKLAEERIPPPAVSPDELLFPVSELEGGSLDSLKMRPIYRAAWLIVRFLSRVLFNVRYFNEERLKVPGGMVIACNHVAWLDPPISGGGIPRELHFVAKRELFRFRPLGAFFSLFNTIPISRGTFDRECFDELRRRLQAGATVFFFPEGTRKPVGRLGKAKFGVGLVAHESGLPVMPVFVRGTRNWRQAIFRRKPMTVHFGRLLHTRPLEERGLEGRELFAVFGEGLMAEIARLQNEVEGPL